MKSKGTLYPAFGLIVLCILGFVLSKPTNASSPAVPAPVQVVNKPTVTVGNTPSVTVTNTPSVSILSMPPVQNFFVPVQVSGNCTYAVGSSTCTVNGVYTVPAGETLVVTQYSGLCNVLTDDYATVAAQLSVQTATGSLQAVTVPATTSGSYLVLNDWSQSLTFYGASETSLTVQLLSGGPQSQAISCFYTITGNLAPFAS